MTVEHISEGMGAHQVQKGYLDAKKKTESPQKETKAPTKASDRVEISKDAKKLMEQDTLVRKMQGGMDKVQGPPIRYDKIQLAETRARTGHYQQKDVLDKIASAILREGGGAESLDSTQKLGQISEPEVRMDKIQEVNERIQHQYYERQEVYETVIDRLLNV